MAVTRANVEATKDFIRKRLGNPYVYGGSLSSNVRVGTDCSEVWQTVLEMVHGRWVPGRQSEGATTESYRYIPVGGRGPFGTIRVAHYRDIPSNAAAKLAFHHGPGGGANSHMWGELDGMLIESGGSKGLATAPRALSIENSYGHAWAYLPGPILEDGTPPAPELIILGRNYESRGERVRALQIALNAKGARLEVDGDFGPATEGAVTAYQRGNGLDVDGVAGPQTLGHLGLTFGHPMPQPNGDAVKVLATAIGVTEVRAAELLGGIRQGLIASECTNINRIAMWLAQMGHESAGFKATEEYASGSDYEGRLDLGNTQRGDGVRFKGRSWVQITGRHNYTQLSKWAHGKGIVPTPTFFVDNPTRLAEVQYAGLGPAWYWTVARPDINRLSDNGDIVTVTYRINGGQNGIADRRERYRRAINVGDKLLTLIQSTDPIEELLMSNLELESLSIYATPGEPKIPVTRMIQAIDAALHRFAIVEPSARLGDPDALMRLARTADGRGKFKDAGTVAHAKKILLEIATANPEFVETLVKD